MTHTPAQAPTIARPYDWQPNAAHSVPMMLCLEYRTSARARKWHVAQRMHVAGLGNMKRDAAQLSRENGWWDWRIVQEYDPRHFPNGPSPIDQPDPMPLTTPFDDPEGQWRHTENGWTTELTPEGEQHVIPGCERNASPKARQLDLFG